MAIRFILFIFLSLFLFTSDGLSALNAKAGQITQPTSTDSSFDVTGVGFEPKAVILFGNGRTSDGDGGGNDYSYGIGLSSSSRMHGSCHIPNSNGNARANTGKRDEVAVWSMHNMVSDNFNLLALADLVSLDLDGFTLNFSTVDATARKINYLALGGDDLTNIAIGKFAMNTSTGTQAVTGVGFQPDAIIILGFPADVTASSFTSTFEPCRTSFGYGISSTERAVSAGYAYRSNRGDGASYQVTDAVFAQLAVSSGTPSLLHEADLDSLDSDGFTVDWTTVTGNAYYIHYIALKGGQYHVGSISQKTSTGTQAYTGVGFQGTAIMASNVNATASSSVSSDKSLNYGVATSSTERFNTTQQSHQQPSGNSITAEDLDSTSLLKTADENAFSLNAEADFDSFDSDEFNLDYVTADATAREIITFVMGSDGAGGGGWGGKVNGVSSPAYVNGVANANIAKVNGVAA